MKSFNVLDRNLNVLESYHLEASAGTGKTFSIENIVVRLLIDEHHPLLIDQILIVTFTKTATKDLKKRVRENILKALKILEGKENDKKIDYLEALLEKGETALFLSIERLKVALFTFDQAQIFTIHSFCFKMISSHLLESHISLKGVTEDSALLNTEILKIIRNFFRVGIKKTFFSPAQLKIVIQRQQSKIENLEKSLLNQIKNGFSIHKTANFQQHFDQFKKEMALIKVEKEKLISDFNVQIVNYKKLKDHASGDSKVAFFASLFERENITEEDFDKLIEEGLYYVEALDETLLRVKQIPIANESLFYPGLEILIKEKIFPIVQEARSYEVIFSRMAAICQEMVERYVEEEDKFRHDDLLKKMQKALKQENFLKKVREKFSAAIIDEFQDTDKVQWNIFRDLFFNVCPLYLVGDPKQSIYSFRQADIYTYLEAKEGMPKENHCSLDTNYRSDPSLVLALNALFKRVPKLIDLPKIHQFLEYPEVNFSSSKKDFPFQDNLAPLHFFIVEEEQKESVEEKFYFPFILEQIKGLLMSQIKLKDIAILVKDHAQGKRVSDYLKERGVDVKLQKEQLLSDTGLFEKVTELLLAVISPRDESALKLALGGPLIGFTHVEILSLNIEDKKEAILAKFFYLKNLLFGEEFAKFLDAFISMKFKTFSVAEELLRREEGLSLYRNFLQIGECLIQKQSEMHATPYELLTFLKNYQILNFDSDERMKKFSDDGDDAVKILTIHSSKGLEFEIVFALGLIGLSPKSATLIPVDFQEEKRLVPFFSKKEESYKNYFKEVEAEKMRQLYVAMTRAKLRLYIPAFFSSKNKEKDDLSPSCLDVLLKKLEIEKTKSDEFVTFLEELKTESKISYEKLESKIFDLKLSRREETHLLEKPLEKILSFEPLFLHSFTSLSKKTAPLKNKDIEQSEKKAPHDFENPIKNRHTLPSGAKTGVLLHSIFESLPFEKYQKISHSKELDSFVLSFIEGTPFEAWKEVISEIIWNVLQVPLKTSLGNFKLNEIDPYKIFREQEFMYSLKEDDGDLNKGLMKGVIDFMFLHEDKYYLVDWKSNWLGEDENGYKQDSLINSMQVHDYFLQANIYKETLYRFLTLLGKDFESSFGGIFYLFLRGIDCKNEDKGVLFFKETL